MGSTNKTTNIGLSQYIGTDKPTWLVDYNNDMAVIDEAIGELQNDSGLTDTAIAELQTNVQNLQNGQGDSATEIAEVKSNVQTLSANYETMHHELVLNQEDISNVKKTIAVNNTFKTQTFRDMDCDIATISLARLERIGNVGILNIEFVLKANITATGWTTMLSMFDFTDVIESSERCITSASTYSISSNIADTYPRVASAVLDNAFQIFLNANNANPTSNTRASITFFIQ